MFCNMIAIEVVCQITSLEYNIIVPFHYIVH